MVLSAETDHPDLAPHPRALKAKGSRRLWFALGAPPAAWFVAQNAAYFFVAWACARTNGEAILHVIAIAALLVCIAAGLAAWTLLTDVGPRGDDDRDDPHQRTRFLARLALAGALVFALILVTQWIAIVVQDPCMPYPRSRFTPDA